MLNDSAFHESGGLGWDDVLMVASFIPIVGDFVDGATALYYLAQGDWDQAALSGLGLLPLPGMSGASVRGARAAVGEVGEEVAEDAAAGLAQRGLREAADEAEPGGVLFSHAGSVTNAEALTAGTRLPFHDDTVFELAERGGVGLDDVRVQLLRAEDEIRYLDSQGGIAFASDDTIFLGPAAFTDEELLVRTLAHERTHLYQQQVWRGETMWSDGRSLVPDFEEAAYGIEDSYWDYYQGGQAWTDS